MINFTNIKKELEKNIGVSNDVERNDIFKFNIDFLDNHIATVMKNTEASYEQVTCAAITIFGFILSHGGIENTSLMMLDLSSSGTGKSFNLTMQYKLLLKSIAHQQDSLQLSTDDEESVKRYINIHRGKVTLPALYQCIKTVPSQLLIVDELGLMLQKDDDIISEVTKLYGANEAAVPLLKTEVPTSKSIVPVSLSFIGATTLSYFGSTVKLKHHLSGGFINRAFIAYNNRLKAPEEITTIGPGEINYDESNQKVMELLSFIKGKNISFEHNNDSSQLLLDFKREIQAIKFLFNTQGNDDYALFYNRSFQNTTILINILHTLKCFEKKVWEDNISTSTVKMAISFVKEIAFSEIEKLIDYLSDHDLIRMEEKQKAKIIKFVDEFYLTSKKMPKIRDLSQKTRLSRDQILTLTKDYLEVVPGSTIFRYCNHHD